MDPKIIYTNNRRIYFRYNNGEAIISIPVYLKWNEKLKKQIIEKGNKYFEKIKKKNHLKGIDENFILLFGESVEKSYFGKDIEKELKQILGEYITPIIDEYSQKIGYKYKSIRIGKAKTKRGSCSSDQKLMFNINLVHLQTKYIKYVIIHEICHLKHKNHSKKFRDEVEGFLPNYKEIKKEMKNIIIE